MKNIAVITFFILIYSNGFSSDELNFVAKSTPLSDICTELVFHNNFLYGIFQASGIMISRDTGMTWENANDGIMGPKGYSKLLPADSGIFLYNGYNLFKFDYENNIWRLFDFDPEDEFSGINLSFLSAGDSVFTIIQGRGLYYLDPKISRLRLLNESINIYSSSSKMVHKDGIAFLTLGPLCVLRSLNNFVSYDTVFIPYHDNRIINTIFLGAGQLYILYSDTLYHSSDNGDTWNSRKLPFTTVLPGFYNDSFSNLYIAPSLGEGQPNIFSSSDGGFTWEKFFYTPCTKAWMNVMHFHDSLALINLYSAIAISNNSGHSWDYRVFPGYPSVINNIAPTNNGELFVSNGNALFRTKDDAWTFSYIAPVCSTKTFFRVLKDRSNIVATNGSSILNSTDDGISWNIWESSNNRDLCKDSHGNFYYAHDSTVTSILKKSTDGGQTWMAIDENLLGMVGGRYRVSSIGLDRSDNLYIILSGGIYKLLEGPSHWDLIAAAFDYPDPAEARIIPSGDRLYFAGFSSRDSTQMYRLGDNGYNCQVLNKISKINRGDIIPDGCGELIFFGKSDKNIPSKLYRSSNRGMDWHEIETNIPDSTFSAISLDVEGILWVGTDKGNIYKSSIPVGILDTKYSAGDFMISPNPANEIVKLNLNTELECNGISCRIINFQGELLQKIDLRNNSDIYISSLFQGIYFIQLFNGHTLLGIQKLIKL